MPRVALAHTGQPLAPHDLSHAWLTEPFATLGVVVLGAFYVLGVRRLRGRAGGARGLSRGATTCFAFGWLVLALALVSPLHALGGALFSAHMAQHELLMSVAAPLLVLGRPTIALAWAVPRRLSIGVAHVARRFNVLTNPWIAAAVHGVAIWLWHLPTVYALTLRSELAHAAQHASFLGTALLFWWPLLDARHAGARRGTHLGTQLGVLFLTALHTGALGALLAFAPRPLVTAYFTTTAPWGFTPLEDQQLAGLLMWIPGGAAYLVAGLWLLARALRDDQSSNSASSAATSASPSYGFSRNPVPGSARSRSTATSAVYPDM